LNVCLKDLNLWTIVYILEETLELDILMLRILDQVGASLVANGFYTDDI